MVSDKQHEHDACELLQFDRVGSYMISSLLHALFSAVKTLRSVNTYCVYTQFFTINHTHTPLPLEK